MTSYTREKRLRTRSEGGSLALGEMLVEMLAGGAQAEARVVLLRGELGMGKTTLVRGMAVALGVAPEEVTSPTFALVQEYATGSRSVRRLIHMDLYRLETEAEVEGIGFWEMAAAPGALLLVEWGERFARVAERADAEIAITEGEAENERLLEVRWSDRG